MTAAFEQSVTIRGNLANPGKFPWHPGMRLSEIIPDRQVAADQRLLERAQPRRPAHAALFEPMELPPKCASTSKPDSRATERATAHTTQAIPATARRLTGASSLYGYSQNTRRSAAGESKWAALSGPLADLLRTSIRTSHVQPHLSRPSRVPLMGLQHEPERSRPECRTRQRLGHRGSAEHTFARHPGRSAAGRREQQPGHARAAHGHQDSRA